MPPLSADQYAPGQKVKSEGGDTVEVRSGPVVLGNERFLLVSSPGGDICGLVPEGTVRDTYEVGDDDDTPTDTPTDPEQTGTDGTGGTGSQER